MQKHMVDSARSYLQMNDFLAVLEPTNLNGISVMGTQHITGSEGVSDTMKLKICNRKKAFQCKKDKKESTILVILNKKKSYLIYNLIFCLFVRF